MKSRLRRDKQALKWARYTRRNTKLSGHALDNWRTDGSMWAEGWLYDRRVRSWDIGSPRHRGQVYHVRSLFYNA